jgi:hypothetical protein
MGYKFNPFTGNLDVVDTTAAAGSTTQVQFNNSGVLDGSADLTWDDTGKVLEVGGDIDLDDGGTYTTTLQTITPTAARTISFPDATGTVALVAGSSGQLVYNNAGAQAGAPGSVVGATGDITLGLNGAASTPPLDITGTWFTGGTATTTKPQVLIEPTGATSTAWSTSGTGLGVNAPAAFAGNLLDLQVNGTSQFRFTSGGGFHLNGQVTGISYYNSGFITACNSTYTTFFSSSELRLLSTLQLGWSTSGGTAYGVEADIGLTRSGANTLKVTDGSTGDGTISGQHRLVGTAPASATATGTAGDIRYDADYIYVCTATNTWKRTAISTW